MPDITITLTDTEVKSLEYIDFSAGNWATSAVKGRARKAKLEIIDKLVAHCNANDIQIATGEDAQVIQAYTLGVVDTVANINAELGTPE